MKDEFKPIYELNEQHLKELHSLFQEEWWTKDRTLDEIKIMVKNSLSVALIDEKTGELAGFARALTDNVFRAFIYDVMIKETCRKKGLGKKLMEAVLEHPTIKNAERVELYCKENNRSYYEKLGFTDEVNGSKLMRLKK